MKVPQKRICIYPKDIQRITGKSERYSRLLMNKIRIALNKKEHELISIENFCFYTGLNIDSVASFLID